MDHTYITARREQHDYRSGYAASQEAEVAYALGPIFCTPSDSYFEKFTRDAALLKEALSSYTGSRTATLAEQVFGNQARQQKIGLGHLANVLYERAVFHKRHLHDIDHRLTQCQDRLSVLKMQFPLDGGRAQQHLEKLILELEKQRRDEELGFWKDSVDIRHQLFEDAGAYGATRRREDMLDGVEGNGI